MQGSRPTIAISTRCFRRGRRCRSTSRSTTAAGEQYEADVWLDRGLVLVLVLLPLLALSFRRGWICVWLLVLLAPLPRARRSNGGICGSGPISVGSRRSRRRKPQRAAELFETRSGAAPRNTAPSNSRTAPLRSRTSTRPRVTTIAVTRSRKRANFRPRSLRTTRARARARRMRTRATTASRRAVLARTIPSSNSSRRIKRKASKDSRATRIKRKVKAATTKKAASRPTSSKASRASKARAATVRPRDGAAEEPNDGEPQGEEDTCAVSQRRRRAAEATADDAANAAGPEEVEQWASEQAAEQWLRRVPQDPGGLLRRKFLYQYQRLGVDQNGNRVHRRAGRGSSGHGDAAQWGIGGDALRVRCASSARRPVSLKSLSQATVDRAVVRINESFTLRATRRGCRARRSRDRAARGTVRCLERVE